MPLVLAHGSLWHEARGGGDPTVSAPVSGGLNHGVRGGGTPGGDVRVPAPENRYAAVRIALIDETRVAGNNLRFAVGGDVQQLSGAWTRLGADASYAYYTTALFTAFGGDVHIEQSGVPWTDGGGQTGNAFFSAAPTLAQAQAATYAASWTADLEIGLGHDTRGGGVPHVGPLGLDVIIADEDRTQYLTDVSVDHTLDARLTCSISVWSRLDLWRPVIGNRVRLIHTTEAPEDGGVISRTIFGGTVDRITTSIQRPGPSYEQRRRVLYRLSCVSHEQALDRRRINTIYEDKTQQEIVLDLLKTIGPDEPVMASEITVDEGPRYDRLLFVYQSVTECLNKLHDLSGYPWWVTPDGFLHMHERTADDAPYNIDSSLRPGDPEYLRHQAYQTVNVDTHREEYRNIQIVRGGRALTPERLVESFRGDGEQQTFTTSLPVGKTPDIYVSTPDADGNLVDVKQIIGFQGLERDTYAQWLWSGETNQISQNTDDEPLTASQILRVEYHGLHYVVVQRSDSEAIINRRGVEGTTGRYEHVHVDQSLRSADAVRAETQALLDRHSAIPTVLNATTFRGGLDVGQRLRVKLPEHGIDASEDFLIQSVSIKKYNSRLALTTIGAISTGWIGGWESFYRRLLERRPLVETGDAERYTTAVGPPDAVISVSEPTSLDVLDPNYIGVGNPRGLTAKGAVSAAQIGNPALQTAIVGKHVVGPVVLIGETAFDPDYQGGTGRVGYYGGFPISGGLWNTVRGGGNPVIGA